MGRKPIQERYFRRIARPGGRITYHRTHEQESRLHTCTTAENDKWARDWWYLDDVLSDISRGLVEEITKAECLVADRPICFDPAPSFITRYLNSNSVNQTVYYWTAST